MREKSNVKSSILEREKQAKIASNWEGVVMGGDNSHQMNKIEKSHWRDPRESNC